MVTIPLFAHMEIKHTLGHPLKMECGYPNGKELKAVTCATCLLKNCRTTTFTYLHKKRNMHKE